MIASCFLGVLSKISYLRLGWLHLSRRTDDVSVARKHLGCWVLMGSGGTKVRACSWASRGHGSVGHSQEVQARGREVTCLSGSGLWAAACAPCGARRGCDIEGHADSAQSVRLGIEVNTAIAMIIIYNNDSEIRVS